MKRWFGFHHFVIKRYGLRYWWDYHVVFYWRMTFVVPIIKFGGAAWDAYSLGDKGFLFAIDYIKKLTQDLDAFQSRREKIDATRMFYDNPL